MRVYSKNTLLRFGRENPNSLQQLLSWYKIFTSSSFNNPNELLLMFNSADILGNGIVVFNIAGNNYRLIVRINYEFHAAYILFIGTHKEYDKINFNLL